MGIFSDRKPSVSPFIGASVTGTLLDLSGRMEPWKSRSRGGGAVFETFESVIY